MCKNKWMKTNNSYNPLLISISMDLPNSYFKFYFSALKNVGRSYRSQRVVFFSTTPPQDNWLKIWLVVSSLPWLLETHACLTRTIIWNSFKPLFPTELSQHFYSVWLSNLSLNCSFNVTESFKKMLNILYPWRYSIFWWNKQHLKILTSLKMMY